MPAPPPSPTLDSLSSQIRTSSSEIATYLHENNLSPPSFNPSSPTEYPDSPQVHKARMTLISAAFDILHLAIGPAEYLRSQVLTGIYDQASLAVLNDFDVWSAVPLQGSTSYASIAAATGVPEDLLRRVLRHSMALRIFAETENGEVAHTAASASCVRTQGLKAWIGHMLDEGGAAAIQFPSNIREFGDGDGDPGRSPVAAAFFPGCEKERTVYQWMETDGDGWRMRRFGEAMAYASSSKALHVSHANRGFDWDGLGVARVVDIGGSVGHLSFELAKEHPKLRCVVQDYAELEPQFEAALPTELKDRVSFQPHDFFTPQTTKAEVYVIRSVLLNWSDKYAVRIIRNLFPAMEPGNRILVIDTVLPPRGAAPALAERTLTSIDLHMWANFNSKLRSATDWRKLFTEASPNLDTKRIVAPPGSGLQVIEVVLEGK